MKEVLITIFGAYEPVLNTVVTDTGEVVSTVVSGLSGVDWPWMMAVLLFAVVLYCFFRLVGVLLK